MVTLWFLNNDNAPMSEAAQALPQDLETPSVAVLNKTVVLFHDETTFQACDTVGNQKVTTFWFQKAKELELWFQILLVRNMGICN